MLGNLGGICITYMSGRGGGGGWIGWVGWGWRGGGKETCQDREKRKMTHREIKSSSPEEMKYWIGPLLLVDCTYLSCPPNALGSNIFLNVPIRQAPNLLPMYTAPPYVFEDGFIVDRVQASPRNKNYEWIDNIELRTRLNQFEMFEEHENCLSRWKQCCSRWKQRWKKTMYK